MIEIVVTETIFNPWDAIQTFQQQPEFNAQQSGANAVFVGTMRDFNEGEQVQAMRLEHYPAMTQKHLQQVVDKAVVDWGLNHVLLQHRVGDLIPAEPIVLVAVWSAHRRASFKACRQIMEDLKHQAPFWKQETLKDGTQRWVEKNTAG
ncbi:MAG: molybdenum cofactor biosynthesis protein MoaE [Thiothrix sp.]|nr:MAG: molybdenum cofactor biosynthesis protein MoaE [Thiothrix sp.]